VAAVAVLARRAVGAPPAVAAVVVVVLVVAEVGAKLSTHFIMKISSLKTSSSMTALVVMLLSGVCTPLLAQQNGRSFATPQDAVAALSQAVNGTNRTAFSLLFGSAAEELANPDVVQGAREIGDFAAALNATNRLVRQSDTQMLLEVGPGGWPFPIPIVKRGTVWQFDTAAGREEILNRRIGRNELDVLLIMRAYVNAQREYASRDHDGDQVLEYAQRLNSSPGQTDGLYWPVELNGEVSPLGPLVAYAQQEGYAKKSGADQGQSEPFHGYFFKILTKQGKNTPGGKYDYVINGNMIAGFALIAWPAVYGDTGVMTFIVNQQGQVYQKDLGRNTDAVARKMDQYDSDPSWRRSSD
jgi:hypothetical protein